MKYVIKVNDKYYAEHPDGVAFLANDHDHGFVVVFASVKVAKLIAQGITGAAVFWVPQTEQWQQDVPADILE